MCYIIYQHKHTSVRDNISPTRRAVVDPPPTSTAQQPPAFNMAPRPEAAQPADTATTTDPSITAAPPPAYGLADNYANYNEGQSDLPPPSYSETRPSLSLPPSAPPLYPAQSTAFVYPPSYPPQP